jgi:hypothetical protein
VRQPLKTGVFFFPIGLFIALIGIKAGSPDIYASVIREDTGIENTQALVYLASALLAFFLSAKFHRNGLLSGALWHGVLAIGLLFVSIEEISWGQRLLGLEPPEFFTRYNSQHEISVHNLEPFQFALHGVYILIGAYGSFAWILAKRIKPRLNEKLWNIVSYMVPDWLISPYFFFTFFTYILLESFRPGEGSFLKWKDQEIAELLLSLGFLVFVLSNHLKLRDDLRHRN